MKQQQTAHVFGLWIFLATEMLFFGGLFAAYLVYRYLYPDAFVEAASETEIVIGSINTLLLLTSGMTTSLAVKAAGEGDHGAVSVLILATLVLGFLFLGAKGYEYVLDLHHHLWPSMPDFKLADPPTRIFWSLYWLMTGMHAVHMSIGLGTWIVLLVMVRRRSFPLVEASRIRIAGLYWGFVDMMWLIIWPLLYLVGRP
nr:cytochrome c oxidase subunit 3 [Aurantimonas sp. VKM B-3413]